MHKPTRRSTKTVSRATPPPAVAAPAHVSVLRLDDEIEEVEALVSAEPAAFLAAVATMLDRAADEVAKEATAGDVIDPNGAHGAQLIRAAASWREVAAVARARADDGARALELLLTAGR